MTPWTELSEKNLEQVPKNILGVFQLAVEADRIAYVGRAEEDLQSTLRSFLGKRYRYFQWVRVPWPKEAFEMHCRLYHHAGKMGPIDNREHPHSSTQGKANLCPMSRYSTALCDSQELS